MSLSAEMIEGLAGRLDRSESAREQIGHFSLEYPDLTIDDAYAIQRAWIARKMAAGRVVKGHKIGLTSKAMQRFSNINEPDYGTLLDDMIFFDGAEIQISHFIVPQIEVELAFVLKEPLSGPGCTLYDVLSATEYVTPALEIIDWRIRQTDLESKRMRKVVDTISDNAASAGIVLGGRPFRPLDHDLRWVAAMLYKNAVIETSGVAGAVLNHPANGPAWLANKLHAHGVNLEAGQVILGGSFTPPVPLRAGDVIAADYGPFGQITARFV
jgi:2-oxo-hept-3-ene-1,7-dioate hydratase